MRHVCSKQVMLWHLLLTAVKQNMAAKSRMTCQSKSFVTIGGTGLKVLLSPSPTAFLVNF